MNKKNDFKSTILKLKNFFISNLYKIFSTLAIILLFFIIYQFYLFNENKKILQSSIVYNEAKKNKSQLDFLESMTELIN